MRTNVGIVCTIGVGPGRGGRAHNGDNYLLCRHGSVAWRSGDGEHHERMEGYGVLAAVCDGIGDDDDLASTTGARVVAKLYRPEAPHRPTRVMRQFLLDAHKRLYDKSRGREHKLGTSVTATWVIDRTAHWVHVGDSRLYLYRDDRLTLLTSDHTRAEMARRAGLPSPADGSRLAQAFMLGSTHPASADLRIDPGLDTGSEPLVPGDRLLACTDGIHRHVDDTSLADLLRHVPDPQAAAVACSERAIARGSLDNLTAIVLKVS